MKIKIPKIKLNIDQIVRTIEFFQEPNLKGFMGEFVVYRTAQKRLPNEFKILSNVVLKSGDGTTQIDQILVSPYGIFVVEVKNYKGWIFANNRRWTQVLYNEKHQFQSPVRQNRKHVKALQTLLKLPDEMFKSIIVFSERATFKTDLPENVVRGSRGYLNCLFKYQTVLLDDYAADAAVKMIERHGLSDAEHRDYMKKLKKKYYTGDVNNPPSCPACDRKMVLRTTKNGVNKGRRFWGCEGFPDCRATLNIRK